MKRFRQRIADNMNQAASRRSAITESIFCIFWDVNEQKKLSVKLVIFQINFLTFSIIFYCFP